jgi:prepilin-type N-terminal cleavage/methylation domain-containing protein
MRNKSFTLVELLISLAIFSVVILSIYSAFGTGITSYNRIDSAFTLYQRARVILKRMELDLNNGFVYSPLGPETKFKGSEKTLEFFTVADIFQEDKIYSQVCRIKYSLNNDILTRTSYQGLAALETPEGITPDELASDVKDITFAYAYWNREANKLDWENNWPREQEISSPASLPLAVKITLSLIEKDKHGKQLGAVSFSKTVPLNGVESFSDASSTSHA